MEKTMYEVVFLNELVLLEAITVIEETETQVITIEGFSSSKEGLNSKIFEDFEDAKLFAKNKMIQLISGIEKYLLSLKEDLENIKTMEKP